MTTEAEQYRQRREGLKLTRHGLAVLADLSHRVVYKLERGENISQESKQRIDEALRRRAEELAPGVHQELCDETPAA